MYHGPGNLNFSFILPRNGFSKEENLDLIRRSVSRCGVQLERTERGDLTAYGKKVSGNALCYRRSRVIHHGTLLVAADLGRLRGSLRRQDEGSSAGLVTHAVASLPSPVANLSEYSPGLTTGKTADAIAAEAVSCWGPASCDKSIDELTPPGLLDELAHKHESWEWVYGATPAFSISSGPKGGIVLHVKGGRIERTEGLDMKKNELIGSNFQLSQIEELRHLDHEPAQAAKEDVDGNSGDVTAT